MYIITVIPIARAISKDTLTYFTKQDIRPGSIVSIPLRKKTVYGLVVESAPAQEIKSELRALSYSIKKIENLNAERFISDTFIKSAKVIADYYATSIGAVLSVLIPKAILEGSSELAYPPQKAREEGAFHETLLIQSDDEERMATYKSFIREEFARGRSVFFCLPTTEDIRNAKDRLEKGIETYTYTLHSGQSKTEILKLWKHLVAEPHPVLIIATGSFLSLPREDIGTIIVDKENSRGFGMQMRPFIDLRTAARIIAKESNRKCIFGDTLLRTETLWEQKNGTYAELTPLKFRSLSTASCALVDMRGPIDAAKKDFRIFGDMAQETLASAHANAAHTFIFSGRKGLYPSTVCSDCGTVVVCTNCGSPMVLYGKDNARGEHKNLFVCHQCGERRDAHELCKHCNGWRLATLGIGSERIAEEVTRLVPGAQIMIMDKDHVASHKQAIKIQEWFYNTPGSILIGTEMALPYLNQKIEHAIAVSLDSLFSIPDFRIHEKIFYIILGLRSAASQSVIVQTRQKDHRIIDDALRGNLMDFYRQEIEERQIANYPPFTTYVKLTVEGPKKTAQAEMEKIAASLAPHTVSIFDAFNPGSASHYTVHGLIALPRGSWVDPDLLRKLRGLPPHCMVKIDPDTLL